MRFDNPLLELCQGVAGLIRGHGCNAIHPCLFWCGKKGGRRCRKGRPFIVYSRMGLFKKKGGLFSSEANAKLK